MSHQSLHLLRHNLLNWLQIFWIALGNRIPQPIKGPQRSGDREPDDQSRAGDQCRQPQRRPQQDRLRKLGPGDSGLGHRNHERH